MATVYLDTSFISACVTDREDSQSLSRRQTSLNWWASQVSRHDVFISPEVVNEISDPSYSQRASPQFCVKDIPILPADQTYDFAALLVQQKVMPGPITGDAAHVAIAAIHGMQFLLSWNVRHLANPNKAMHLSVICNRVGLTAPRIVTPDLLWE